MYIISQKSENCKDNNKKRSFFMKSCEKAIINEKYKKMNLYLFLLIILDYLLTYIGIHNLALRKEASPFQW